jgi:hypothetical protein
LLGAGLQHPHAHARGFFEGGVEAPVGVIVAGRIDVDEGAVAGLAARGEGGSRGAEREAAAGEGNRQGEVSSVKLRTIRKCSATEAQVKSAAPAGLTQTGSSSMVRALRNPGSVGSGA